jgi:hypothetical protein
VSGPPANGSKTSSAGQRRAVLADAHEGQAVQGRLGQALVVVDAEEPELGHVRLAGGDRRLPDGHRAVEAVGEQAHQTLGVGRQFRVAVAEAGVGEDAGTVDPCHGLRPVQQAFVIGIEPDARERGDVDAGVAPDGEEERAGAQSAAEDVVGQDVL